MVAGEEMPALGGGAARAPAASGTSALAPGMPQFAMVCACTSYCTFGSDISGQLRTSAPTLTTTTKAPHETNTNFFPTPTSHYRLLSLPHPRTIMADVRSMLRQERASRQQTGPPQKQSARPASAPISKKRKAADDNVEERKRTRTEVSKGVPAGFFDGGPIDAEDINLPTSASNPALAEDAQPATAPRTSAEREIPAIPDAAPPPLKQADEEDLDAFLKEMDEAPAAQNTLPPFALGAVVEAAPMTAAEVAAQARKEQSAQRGKREEELEAEKEDAARLLEDEFEEMEGLEERVRKLREKREALRHAHMQARMEDIVLPDPQPETNEDEGSESDDEDWDDWRFRPA